MKSGIVPPESRDSVMGTHSTEKHKLRFGPFVADLEAGELYKRGKKIAIQQQPLQVLAALVERPRELVSREELQKRIWTADTFVDFEHSLNTAVKKLRQALGDDPNRPKYIETLARRGYRFLAEVEATDERVPLAAFERTARGAGRIFVLEAEQDTTCVVAPVNEKCLEEWQRLKGLGDDVGISMMIAEDRLLLLEPGKNVRVLSGDSAGGWCEARILEGEHYGKRALVPKKALRRDRSSLMPTKAQKTH